MITDAGKSVRLAVLFTAALLLAACLSNRVQTLGPNLLRLDMTGAQIPAETEAAFQQLLALAAQETLSRGYELFRFKDWAPGPTKVARPGEPLVANFSVTVVMMHAGEQGVGPAFDARLIASQNRPAQ